MKKGFSLLELIVVVAISGIILGGFFASWTRFRQRKALESATLELISQLKLSRARAVNGEKPSSFVDCVFLDGYEIDITADCSFSSTPVCHDSSGLPVRGEEEAIASNYDVSCNAANFTFHSLSGKVDTPMGMNIGHAWGTKRIEVSASGVVSLEEAIGCSPGWGACDANPDNGCETRLGTVYNCACCHDVCTTSNECRNPVCVDSVCGEENKSNGTPCSIGNCWNGWCSGGGGD